MKLIKTKLNGLDFWYRSDDKYVGQRIALGKYEEYETKLLLRQLRSNDIVVDVGANIGYYTLLMAQKVNKVVAIEPDKENFKILNKNIKVNNLKNVEVINAAVGNKQTKIKYYQSEENFGDGRVYRTIIPRTSYSVTSYRLDDVLKNEPNISLIKIDTQGWEPAVIEGAKKIIEKDKPIIFLEYWPEGYRNAGLDGRKMLNYLHKEYKNIWQIDNYINVYKRVVTKVGVDKKTGYIDLWVTDNNIRYQKIDQIRNIKIKKIIKKTIGL